MSEHDSARPLLEDASLDRELRGALEAAREHDPSRAELDGLAARLAAALPPGTLPPTPAPPPPTPVGAAGMSVAAKTLAGLAIVSAVGASIWVAHPAAAPAPAPTVSVAPPPSASPTASTPPLAASVAPPPSASASSSAPASAPVALRAATPQSATASSVAAPSEAALLTEAHEALLHGSAARALALASEHRRAYPSGALAQEREVIAVEALVRLGRRDEARRRAEAFHASYPGSPHGDRVDRLVEGP